MVEEETDELPRTFLSEEVEENPFFRGDILVAGDVPGVTFGFGLGDFFIFPEFMKLMPD